MRRRTLRDLKAKTLVWGWNCETLGRTKFIVWKRNCVTSSPQYFPCAEAELHHFRAPSHTLFCMRKRNCETLGLSIFLMRRRNFKPKNIPCVEAEVQNFKSHNSLCAESEFKSHNSMYVESLWFLMQESEVYGSAKTCVKAILAVLFSTVPSWRWPLLGLFKLVPFLSSMIESADV